LTLPFAATAIGKMHRQSVGKKTDRRHALRLEAKNAWTMMAAATRRVA